jgi:hypothetical protein
VGAADDIERAEVVAKSALLAVFVAQVRANMMLIFAQHHIDLAGGCCCSWWEAAEDVERAEVVARSALLAASGTGRNQQIPVFLQHMIPP